MQQCLTTAGEIDNTIGFSHGLGRHEDRLSHKQYSQSQKWCVKTGPQTKNLHELVAIQILLTIRREYIDWLVVFVSYFFIRASVMLFVLRLLPPYKKWQQRLIFFTFFLNFAITMIAAVSYGVHCIPFPAAYEDASGGKCIPANVIVVTQQVNGSRCTK